MFIQIISVDGKVIFYEKYQGQSKEINMASFNKGLYFVKDNDNLILKIIKE
jgi:hypothetical protein